eukprot:SAG31_NODE_1967_length_6785_cov_7.007329_1_plen_93_part_00
MMPEDFESQTRDALRQIRTERVEHRTAEHLWRTVFQKLKIIEESRSLGNKVANLHKLFGLADCKDHHERIDMAAHLFLVRTTAFANLRRHDP